MVVGVSPSHNAGLPRHAKLVCDGLPRHARIALSEHGVLDNIVQVLAELEQILDYDRVFVLSACPHCAQEAAACHQQLTSLYRSLRLHW